MEKESLNNILIRKAKPEDAVEITRVYLNSWKLMPFVSIKYSNEEMLNWIKNILIPTGNVTVAIIENIIVGMCHSYNYENSGWIDQLYIDSDFVGRGIGKSLLNNAIKNLNFPIRLYTFQKNETARKFYENNGFKAIKFGDGSENEQNEPDILYELTKKIL